MTALVERLADYAAYHRDHRNVVTHMAGIPLIVVAVAILLSRPMIAAGPLTITPALVVMLASTIWYLKLDLRFGTVMGVLLATALAIGLNVARLPTASWLASGIGIFVSGWIFQFIGHHYEGRKPAFLDDMRGLIVGPLFIVAEIAFALGLRRDVRDGVAKHLSRP